MKTWVMAQSTQDKDETGVLLFQVAAAAFILGQNEAVALRCCSSSVSIQCCSIWNGERVLSWFSLLIILRKRATSSSTSFELDKNTRMCFISKNVYNFYFETNNLIILIFFFKFLNILYLCSIMLLETIGSWCLSNIFQAAIRSLELGKKFPVRDRKTKTLLDVTFDDLPPYLNNWFQL